MFSRYQQEQNKNINSSNPNLQLITEDQLDEKDKRVMSVSAIPDVLELSRKVVEFIEYYDNPATKNLRLTNYPVYLNTLYEKFEKMPASMITILSDEKNRVANLEKVINMLEVLGKVKNGSKNIEEARDEFVEKNNEEYFYPAFGGKDQLIKDIEAKGGKITE